ncbi:MAG: glycoside hydrolase family 27 protein [Paludibacter sp.]|jgi:hypothetical protein|nr:glycoside hydrolase family 27 protein [Paludibacter sp.]
MKTTKRFFWIVFLGFITSTCATKTEQKKEAIIASVPPMGWNTWICFGTSVTEEELKANADFMAEHLKEAGYEYIINDAGWYAPGMVKLEDYEAQSPHQLIDEYGRLIPDTVKYPCVREGKGLKPLANYIQAKGLKFGIHIMRGIPIQAVERNTPVKGTQYRARDIVMMDSKCEWYHGFYGIDMSKPGAQEYYNSIFELYESWNIDYIKADDLLNPVYAHDEIQAIADAIKLIKRPMILSLSPGSAPLENVNHIKSVSQVWRISEDFWDNWESLKHQFELCRKWAPHIERGKYPDADMLPIGPIAQRAMRGETRMANFTVDEQYTIFTLWSMLRSPLMLGCNMVEMDDFTLKLVTNKEIIKINQYSKNNHQFYHQDNIVGWFASAEDESVDYVAVFNLNDDPITNFILDMKPVNATGYDKGAELWTGDMLSVSNQTLEIPKINPHGVVVYKLNRN